MKQIDILVPCYNEEAVLPQFYQRTCAVIDALPVFGTPYMSALMENASMTCLQSILEEGQGSVGTHLNVSHDAPTPVGMKVWAEAEITAVSENGKMIDFAVKAWDGRAPSAQDPHPGDHHQ